MDTKESMYERISSLESELQEKMDEIDRLKALSKDENTARAIMETSTESVFLMDKDGIILQMNEVAASRLGGTVSDLIGKSAYSLLPKGLAKKRKELISGVINTKKSLKFIDERSEFVLENSVYPIIDHEGYVTKLIVYSHNISEHLREIENKRIQAKIIEKSESEYRLIAENTADIIYKLDVETYRFTYINPAVYNTLGYTQDEVLSSTMKDVLTPDSYLAQVDAIKSDIEEDSTEIVERLVEAYHKNGSIIKLELNAEFVRNPSDKKMEIIGIARDVTERKRSEEILRKNEKLLSSILDSLPIPLILSRGEKNEVFELNSKFVQELGYTREELRDVNDWWNLAYPDVEYRNKVQQDWFQMMQAEKEGDVLGPYDARICTRTGIQKIFRMTAQVIENIRVLSLVDLTEIIEANEALENSRKKLIESNATKDKYFSIIGHDLRGPIGTVADLLGVLSENLDQFETDILQKYISSCSNTVNAAFSLLDDLLTWSRSQQNVIELKPELILVKDYIKENIDFIHEQARKKELDIRIPGNIEGAIYADKKTAYTVMRNLLSNAIKFTNRKGEIAISARTFTREGAFFQEISIRDNGIGMDNEKIDRLFRIEQDISTHGTENEKGTGLGLVLCKEFIEKNKGEIWIESKPGEGTDVHIILPSEIIY